MIRRLGAVALTLAVAALAGGCSEVPTTTAGDQPTDQRAPANPAQSQAIVAASAAILASCTKGEGEAAIAPHVTTLVDTVKLVRIDSPMSLEGVSTTPRSEVARLITPLGQCAPGQALALERGTGIEPE